MKTGFEKAGGHVKKKRKMLVGILAALLCMATGAYEFIFPDSLEIKNPYHGRYSDKYDPEFARKGRK